MCTVLLKFNITLNALNGIKFMFFMQKVNKYR